MTTRHPPSSPRTPWIVLTLGLLCGACGSTGTASEDAVFYPEPPDPPRIQFLRTVSFGGDIEGGPSKLDSLLFGEVETRKGVMAPYGSLVHDGIVYVCDIQQGVVLTMDFAGEEFDYLRLDGRARLEKPVNLAVGPDGKLFIADLGRKQIVVIDSDGKYVAEFGPFADDCRPTDVELYGDLCYVADAGSKCVRVLDAVSGEELRTVGSSKSLVAPTNIALDTEGNLYVVDTIACQVTVFDAEGEPSGTIGGPGDTVGNFARPKGIAREGNLLFVIDAAFENCQIIDLAGNPIMFFGGSGVGRGNLYSPAGVWVGSEGLELFEDLFEDDFEPEQLIIVTNLYGPRKVNFYALGRSTRFAYDETEFELRSAIEAAAQEEPEEEQVEQVTAE